MATMQHRQPRGGPTRFPSVFRNEQPLHGRELAGDLRVQNMRGADPGVVVMGGGIGNYNTFSGCIGADLLSFALGHKARST